MAETTFNSTDKEIRTFPAKTDWTLKGTMYNPAQSVVDVSSYKFKGYVRAGAGARVLKTYSHSTGGITLTSGTYGKIQILVDADDIPPTPRGIIDLVGYSGGSYAGDATDRWKLSFSAE